MAEFLLGLITGFLGGFLWNEVTALIGSQNYAHVNGYHLHHSMFGIISFVIALINKNDPPKFWFFIGFGIGIILEHIILNDGFKFITKD